jgi:ParB/RepB/Spo0J family partition protein
MKEFSANSGSALAEELTAGGDQFAHLALALIVTSPTNPRKNFNPVKLQELADSIRASGVHQPVLVRPLPASRLQDTAKPAKGAPRPTHELVSGERRYRASLMADKATVPAMIRNLTDDQVLEIQIVENLQRDDLTELEEAEGYERLMAHSSINADEVGGKIGKSRSYVYARLKLLDLCQEGKQALRDGTIDASRALLIARIPDGKLQIKALEYASEIDSYDNTQPSVRELQTWLQGNVMLRLERAPFKITDAQLVEAAGSCKECPKRTGANPDLFADVDGADICTDPTCYNGKADAHRGILIAKAEAKGMTVIDGAAAKKICVQYGSSLKGYSLLSQQREDVTTPDKLGKLLGKDAPAPVLIENPWTKELIEAVPTEEAEAVLLAKGLIKVTKSTSDKQGRIDSQIAALKGEIDYKIERESRKEIFGTLLDAIRKVPDKNAADLVPPELLRAWLGSELENLDTDESAQVLQMELTGPDDDHIDDKLELRLQAADTATLHRAMAILMILGDQAFNRYSVKRPTPLFDALANDRNIDLAAIRNRVSIQVKADVADQIKALKAELKPKKALTPTTPLAQPLTSPGADAQPTKPAKAEKAPPAAPRKTRLSAQEAQSGIAEALQGIDASPDGAEAAPLVDAALIQPKGPQGNSRAKASPEAQGSLPVGFALGQRVCVLGNVKARHSKWIGKEGTITAKMGDSAWDVTFRGRSGGLASFDAGELEAVES